MEKQLTPRVKRMCGYTPEMQDRERGRARSGPLPLGATEALLAPVVADKEAY